MDGQNDVPSLEMANTDLRILRGGLRRDRAGLRQLAGTTHRPFRRANSHLARTDTAPGRPAARHHVAVRFRAAGRATAGATAGRHDAAAAAPPPPSIGMPTGNLQAPPAYPDAGLPPAAPPVITVPPAGSPAGPPPRHDHHHTQRRCRRSPPPTVDAQFAFPAPTIAQQAIRWC